MVALFCLFHHGLVGGQCVLGLKGGAVDALQAGVGLVTAPVGGGRPSQGKGWDIFRGGNVRAAAQVEPFHLVGARVHVVIVRQIAGTHLSGLIGIRVHVALVLDKLQLEGLILQGLFRLCRRRIGVTLEALASLDDLLHPLFQVLEILRGEGLSGLEIEIEAVFNGRANAQLGAGELGLYGLGHDVGAGVANDGAAIFLTGGYRDKCRFLIRGMRKVIQGTVHAADYHDRLWALIGQVQLAEGRTNRLPGWHGEGFVIYRCCGNKFRHIRAPFCAHADTAYLAASTS